MIMTRLRATQLQTLVVNFVKCMERQKDMENVTVKSNLGFGKPMPTAWILINNWQLTHETKT